MVNNIALQHNPQVTTTQHPAAMPLFYILQADIVQPTHYLSNPQHVHSACIAKADPGSVLPTLIWGATHNVHDQDVLHELIQTLFYPP